MSALRTSILLVQSLVILTIGIAGAAVIDSLLADSWHGVVISISRANRTTR